MARILLIDDDPEFSGFLRESLERNGHQVDCLESTRGAPELLSQRDYAVVLLDNKLPGLSGIEFLAARDQREISVPVILMTGDPTADIAIQAFNLGAFNYVIKPLELEDLVRELEPMIAKAEELVQLRKKRVVLPGDTTLGGGPQLLGNSRPMVEVYEAVGRVASQNVTVLVRGESGTGKELIAHAIHQHSRRADQKFLAINCAAIPDALLESELFGHEKGAFSGAERLRVGKFEQCSGGTLFLDEIGDMSPLVQSKVLRVLQEQKFERVGGNETIETDVRIITASYRDLKAMVAEGTFRTDLYFRLNVYAIDLPPLRERGNDILLLIERFLARFARELGKEVHAVSPAALELLAAYPWPGNVRELQSVIRKALLLASGPVLVAELLPEEILSTGGLSPCSSTEGDARADMARAVRAVLDSGQAKPYRALQDMLDRELLEMALDECGHNEVQTAERLGLSRNGLRAKMRRLEIGLE